MPKEEKVTLLGHLAGPSDLCFGPLAQPDAKVVSTKRFFLKLKKNETFLAPCGRLGLLSAFCLREAFASYPGLRSVGLCQYAIEKIPNLKTSPIVTISS